MTDQQQQKPLSTRHNHAGSPSPRHAGRRGGKRPREGSNWESRGGRHRRRQHNHYHSSAAAALAKQPPPRCSQCQNEEPKYKCPKCRTPYCSIACCRAHKEAGCSTKKEKPAAKGESKYLPSDLLLRDPLENGIQRRKKAAEEDEDLDEGWKVTKEMMDKMDSCDWLRTELADGGLRQIIHQVCEAPNTVAHGQETHQELALKQAKANYPNFNAFIDKLLVLTDVLERQETDSDLNEWLERNVDDLGPLALVPIPRKRRPVLAQDRQSEASSSSSSSDEGDVSEGDESESSEETSSDDDDGE